MQMAVFPVYTVKWREWKNKRRNMDIGAFLDKEHEKTPIVKHGCPVKSCASESVLLIDVESIRQ